jgi:hypothetical protein
MRNHFKSFIFGLVICTSGLQVMQADDYELFMTRAAHVSYEANYFRSDEVPQQFSQVGLKSKSELVLAKPGGISWDVEGFYTTAEQIFVINPMELSYRLPEPYSYVRLGRVLQDWNYADVFWRRGNWQPRFAWDKLDSDQQGLVGLHVAATSDKTKWTFMASPFFVPEFGPQINLKSGRFTSMNPWFRPPPAEVSVLNKITPANYSLSNPTVEQVVLNPSLALRVEQKVQNGFVALAYAYKPMNQLIFTAPFSLDLSNGQNAEIVPLDIDVNTRVMRHHLISGEWFYNIGSVDAITSATYEKPVINYEIKDTSLNQIVTDATMVDFILTPSAKYYSAFKPHIGYMRSWGGDEPANNEFVEGSFVFERRQQFFDAYKIGFTYNTTIKTTSNLNLRQEVIYDSAQLAASLLSEVRLEYNKNQMIGFKFEALGIVASGVPQETSAFLRDYRANDRFTFEYGYVY